MPDNLNTVPCANDASIYANIDFCKGDKSLPGVRNHAYYIPRRNILTFPRPASSPESLDAVGVITTDFTLDTDKVWHRIALVPNESEPNCKNQGSYGSKSFLNTITLVLPGTGKKVSGLIHELNNDDVIFLVPMADGKCRLFGSPNYQAEIEEEQSFGKTAADPNTTTITVTVNDEYAAPFYEGKIATSNGDISGATDELATT